VARPAAAALRPLHRRRRLVYGPVALFAIEPVAETINQKQFLAAQRIGNSSAREVAADAGKVRTLPYPDIKDETYSLYQQT
jgi:hypothetical protein